MFDSMSDLKYSIWSVELSCLISDKLLLTRMWNRLFGASSLGLFLSPPQQWLQHGHRTLEMGAHRCDELTGGFGFRVICGGWIWEKLPGDIWVWKTNLRLNDCTWKSGLWKISKTDLHRLCIYTWIHYCILLLLPYTIVIDMVVVYCCYIIMNHMVETSLFEEVV